MKKLRDQNKIVVESNIDIDSVLGNMSREDYLKANPHGFTKMNKVHKNKKKYSRKRKVDYT